MPNFASDLAQVARNRLAVTGSGANAIAFVDVWIASNPSGTGQELLTYLDSFSSGTALLDLGGASPTSLVAGMSTLVPLVGIREKLRGFINGPFPFLGYAEGR